MDLPLLEAVLGRGVGRQDIAPALLDGFYACHVADQPFPVLLEKNDATARGILMRNPSDEDIARLVFYECGFEFDLKDLDVRSGRDLIGCRVFVARDSGGITGENWDIEQWALRWGALSRLAAVEAMGYFGRISAAELAQKFPMIRARAASSIAASKSKTLNLHSKIDPSRIKEENVETNHAGYFLTKTYNLRHPKFAGELSEDLRREVFVATDAAIVLPYDPVRDVVLLVEQFRLGPYARGDAHPWSIEPVAGRMDAGETAEETARRETVEEASINLISLEKIASYYPTPGYSSEYFNCFLGLCDLPQEAAQIGGLASEDEDIKTHILSFDRAMDLLTTGEADNGPLILSLLWLARERPRLRSTA